MVAGTEPARPWWRYLDVHNADPDGYPAARAIADFEAQPRIAAMVAAPAVAAGEHFTRRQLRLVRAAGFDIVEVQRLKAGTVERVFARKPATA